MTDLRHQVLQGGAILAARQGVGLILGLIGTITITRYIGPASYGLYAGTIAIVGFLVVIGRLGIDVYLVRRDEHTDRAVLDQASTLLALIGIGLALALVIISPPLTRVLTDHRFLHPLMVLLPTIPITLLAVPPIATMERNLDYRAVARLEVGGQICHYSVACTLALGGAGIWAPLAGYWSWQIFALLQSHHAVGYVPRVVWHRGLLADMVRFGLSYSTSLSIWQLRSLVNPFVVGRLLGPEAVGYISLTVRIVEAIGFAKGIAWRLSIAALSKVQGEHARLRRGLEEAMTLEVLTVGPLLATFALACPWIMTGAFGSEWEAAADVYPFIAAGYLVNALFSMHSSVLCVMGRTWNVAIHDGIHVLIFAIAVTVLVPWLGIRGYGGAEIVAMVSYIYVHRAVAALFTFSYLRAAPLLLGFIPPLFSGYLPLRFRAVVLLPLLVIVLWPVQRRQIGAYMRLAKWRPA